MRYNEITSEDMSRRGFLGGLAGAAGLGAIGTSLFKNTSGEVSTSQSSEDDSVKSGSEATNQPAKESKKYSPSVLKQYILDYAEKTLPPNQVVPFIAQVAHESHDFRSLEENLNYSPRILLKRYPKLFDKNTVDSVVSHPNRDEIIANKIYSNRMGNGDYKSGDGYRYRGRGYIQLTGRGNYEKMGKLIGVDLVNNPDLASRPDYAAQIAVRYWQTRVANRVNTGNIAQVTKKISGSSNQGIASRKEKLKQYAKELGKNK